MAKVVNIAQLITPNGALNDFGDFILFSQEMAVLMPTIANKVVPKNNGKFDILPTAVIVSIDGKS